ncbi:toll/interleukin-1 receptor domain-containing protein [Jiella pelagia]|uniref:Toll/interleukin-1 receptor domain-containing protein n=1 Tax=Jiella pelagia TaxID=2986949 RepID=A0ABY7C4C1_9HYPH|nr:toll/interleukin-1 receptor domain-containing protein [Jiella pelagia]WAP70056.1 toll/interleukin-1 receptor domain-containing protein [Jiella pelagia]
MTSVFFSYSHADEALRDRLEKGLAMLKRQSAIDTWHDRRIPAGDVVDSSIDAAMEAADVVLLLVSPDFLASSYCYDVEMKRAMERHERREARLIPIILRPCDWQESPLRSLLATPRDGKPITKWADMDEAFQDVVASIRAALPKQQAAAVAPPPMSGAVREPMPRSSNLRLAKSFTQANQDRFLDDAFEFMARFFEGSLTELQARNQGIETTYKRVDGNHFTAVIYRDGDAKARCKISLGGMFGNGIAFSYNDRGNDNGMNENLSVVVDDHGMFLRALGFGHMGSAKDQNLTSEGASEYYWDMLVGPLQSR